MERLALLPSPERGTGEEEDQGAAEEGLPAVGVPPGGLLGGAPSKCPHRPLAPPTPFHLRPPHAPFPGPLGSSSLVTGGAQGWPLHLGGERDQPGVPPRGTHPLDFAYLLETRSPGIYSLRSS